MDRCGRGRGGGTPYGMPLRRIPPFMPTPTTEGRCGVGASQPAENSQPEVPDETTPAQRSLVEDAFDVSLEDIKEAKMTLTAKGLPWEIVNIIMDKAEYWASTSSAVDYREPGSRVLSITGGNHTRENKFLLRSNPIGLTKWSPPAPDTPGFEAWKAAAKPKVVAEDNDVKTSPVDEVSGGQPELPASSAPTAASVTQEQVDFSKGALEKLTDLPVPTLENPVRKIVFDIVSRDQGHGWSEPDMRPDAPYDHSHTWFDAGTDRFDRSIHADAAKVKDGEKPGEHALELDPDMIRPVWPESRPLTKEDLRNDSEASRRTMNLEPGTCTYVHGLHPDPRHIIQRNERASRDMQHHHVEWTWQDSSITGNEDLGYLGHPPSGNGDFVRSLRLGDMVTIWGRARYLGWTNHVERVEVRVYYAV